MAVKSSGELSMLNDIVAEFGGDAPHALSEYYGGAGLVPQGANPGVPTSGQIRFNNMYGSVAATVLNITSNTSDYNIATAAVAAGGDLNTPVILTINSGVTVSASSSSTSAMTTGQGWGDGTTINITNNGSIVGASGSPATGATGYGGRGGNGWSPSAQASSGSSGSTGSGSAPSACNGGDAFTHAQPGTYLSVIFDTAGTRTGGSAGQATFPGGGGGGGGGGGFFEPYVRYGGGGGGGANGGPGGSGPAGSGGQGGATSGGGAGASGAGNGGNSGQSGQSGYGLPNGFGNTGSGGGAGSTGYANGSAGSALAGNTAQIS